jgi:hypothetical protein
MSSFLFKNKGSNKSHIDAMEYEAADYTARDPNNEKGNRKLLSSNQ